MSEKYKGGGGLMQLVAFSIRDIYITGNPQDGGWVYGYEYGERNPYCSLKYTFLRGKRGELQNKLSKNIIKSFEKLYTRREWEKVVMLNDNHVQDDNNGFMGLQILTEDNTDQYKEEIVNRSYNEFNNVFNDQLEMRNLITVQ